MIDLVNLGIQYGGKYLFEDVNYRINSGEKIAIVGANGTGKSTLLKLISGKEQPEHGKVELQKNIKLGYLPQEFTELRGNTLFNEVKSSLTEFSDLDNEEKEISIKISNDHLSQEEKNKLVAKLGQINHIKEESRYYTIDAEIKKILSGLGFKESDYSRLTEEFSGGWQMRIELAKILSANNHAILLDEPTNHLDIDTLQWLIKFLNNFRGSLLVVSHDKYFVNQITSKTLELFNGNISLYNGRIFEFLKFKEERDKQLEAEFIQQQKKIKDTEKFIERFRYKATKAKQVQSRVKQLEKIDLVELVNQRKEINIKFPNPPRSGQIPIQLNNVRKSYGAKVVFESLDFSIERGEKIAFVGPNGAGKTTLAKIIAEKTQIDSGEKEFGYNTYVSYYAQEVAENLDPTDEIIESVSKISTEQTVGQLRSLLGCFLFSDDDIFKKIKILSGGEKSRVALARILLTKANLIILDEPTNHLDESSKDILKIALQNFSGTIIIVSHDVEFMRGLVNKVVEIREGKVRNFAGDIDYYLYKINSDTKNQTESISDKQNDKFNRRDQKRLEAELRQKKYKVTKELKKKIEKLETEIEALEISKESLEAELAEPKVFSNPELSKSINSNYDVVKLNLDNAFEKWTNYTSELEEIEKEFDL